MAPIVARKRKEALPFALDTVTRPQACGSGCGAACVRGLQGGSGWDALALRDVRFTFCLDLWLWSEEPRMSLNECCRNKSFREGCCIGNMR